MKEERSLKYISNRIILMAAVILGIWSIFTIYHIVLCVKGTEAFWRLLLCVLFMLSYMGIVWLCFITIID